MRFKFYLLISTLILFLSCGSGEWGFVKMLPKEAVVLNEHVWTDGFLPDYDYYLKARMSKSGFLKYAKELELTEHYEGRVYEDKDWNLNLLLSNGNIDWWNPDFDDDTPVYVWQGGDEWVMVKYQNGIMFLHGTDH